MKKRIKKVSLLFLGTSIIYLFLLIFPNPLFAYHYSYKNFEVYSDHPIPAEIEQVLEDAKKRLHSSKLFQEKDIFKLYFCNEN